jgi:type I restriction enzyme S subunit
MEKTMQFDNIVSSIFYQISANIKESERLAALRDTLLPKLMKGEIEL